VDPGCPTQGVAVKMLLVDLCPECHFGDIDMSYPAYRAVTGTFPNRLKVEWDFVECGDDMQGKIWMHPKDGEASTSLQLFFAYFVFVAINSCEHVTTRALLYSMLIPQFHMKTVTSPSTIASFFKQ
jgi:hypothetical protein